MSDTTEGANTSITFDDLVKEAQVLGGDKAKGDDSFAKLFLRLVRAAAEGIIDLEKNKHGDGVDDTRFIYTKFSGARNKKAIHERTDTGFKVQVSKLRSAANVGVMTTCDAIDLFNRAPALHKQMVDGGEKVKSAYAAYIDVARAQIAAGKAGNGDLSDDEIKDAMRKKEAEEPTLDKFLQAEVKRMEKVISGENGFKCQDQRLLDAYDKVRDLYADVAKKAAVDETQNQLAALQTKLATLCA